jgi:hypothetical protein
MMSNAKRTQANITAISRALRTIITDCMAELAQRSPRPSSLDLTQTDKGSGHLLSL